MEKKQVTGIIILNYNNASDTINCIESVETFNTSAIKYIIVDNGSKTECVEDLLSFFQDRFYSRFKVFSENDSIRDSTLPYLSFVCSKTNDGYAKGNNKGLFLANQDDDIDNIMILNNDILFVADIIPGLIEKLDTLKDAAIISPVLYKKDLSGIDPNCARKILTLKQRFIIYSLLYIDIFKIITKIRNRTFLLTEENLDYSVNDIEIELPSGSCMLIKKSLFRTIDYFDPGTFLYYEEDILYSKIKDLHKRNYLDLHLKCIHLGASTTVKSPSAFILKCAIDSNLYYIKNYTDATGIYILMMKILGKIILFKNGLKRLVSK